MHKWERAAWRFIYTQRIEELEKAVRRYPDSDRFQKRKDELEEAKKKLADLDT